MRMWNFKPEIFSETWLLLLEDIRINDKTSQSSRLEPSDRNRNMLSCIHSHYKDKITAAQIADAIGISEREVMRSFRKSLNQSLIEYLISCRNHSVFSPSRLADQCSCIILLIPYFFLYKMNGFAGADYRPPFAPNITDCT